MKQILIPIAVAATLCLTACNEDSTPKLADIGDTMSWAMGENVARTLTETPVFDIDKEIFIKAVQHTLDGKEQPLSEETYTQVMAQLMDMARLQQMKEANLSRQNVDKLQEEYFKQLTARNPKIKKHESGFYYEVLKEGHGRKAKYGDNVNFDYRSFLMLTGAPFDQTYGQREPISHVVGKPMFQGLIDGLQLMNPGSTYRFYFPYQLAFGENGSNGIPGFTPLIYEIEFHSFI